MSATPNLTKDRAALLAGMAMREYVSILKLDDWDFALVVQEESRNDGKMASLASSWADKRATILVGVADVLEECSHDGVDPEVKLVEVILHELLHATHREFALFQHLIVDHLPGAGVQNMSFDAFMAHCEAYVAQWLRVILAINPADRVIEATNEYEEGLNGTD